MQRGSERQEEKFVRTCEGLPADVAETSGITSHLESWGRSVAPRGAGRPLGGLRAYHPASQRTAVPVCAARAAAQKPRPNTARRPARWNRKKIAGLIVPPSQPLSGKVELFAPRHSAELAPSLKWAAKTKSTFETIQGCEHTESLLKDPNAPEIAAIRQERAPEALIAWGSTHAGGSAHHMPDWRWGTMQATRTTPGA